MLVLEWSFWEETQTWIIKISSDPVPEIGGTFSHKFAVNFVLLVTKDQTEMKKRPGIANI